MKTKTKQRIQRLKKRHRDRLVWQDKTTAKHALRVAREKPQTN